MSRRLPLITSILLGLSGAEIVSAGFIFGEAELVPNVNDRAWDSGPAISRDGLELFWGSQRRGGEGNHDLWMATRDNITDDWATPQNLGSPVNSRAVEGAPTAFTDGDSGVTSLLFDDSIWFDPNVPHRPGGSGGGDIWVTTRQTAGGPWDPPTNGILANINTPASEGGPSISSDGLNLLFDSDRGGDFDLYMAKRQTTEEPFRQPTPLRVNSSSADVAPSLSSDGLSLFFSSNRPGGQGVHSMWVATRPTVDDSFGQPRVLRGVNTSSVEAAPAISADGSTLYFLSDRPNRTSNFDLWQVPILPFETLSLNGRRDTYLQDFDEVLGIDGSATETALPAGWTSSDNGIIFENATTKLFPAGSSLGSGTPVYNAGEDQHPDRALALGVTGRSDGGMLQLLADVTEHDATSVQLQFDLEVWDAATRNRDLPGEGAFDVDLDVDSGDGFVDLADLGKVTTGFTLLPAATADLVNGNLAANRVSFDSGQIDAVIPQGSRLRIRWMPDNDGNTKGWVYGLDNVALSVFGDVAAVPLQAGDADQDLDFDQLDLVQVQIAAKYLTGQPATWGEGDWDGAPGGAPGNPPNGDGVFNQFDIIAANLAGAYLQGPYAAIQSGGVQGDSQTSLVYNVGTGELAIDAPSGKELTSINVTSAIGQFIGTRPAVLDGAFDNLAADNVFKATFGGSFGSISFGNILPAGIAESELVVDLSAVGSLDGGGGLGEVDLVYVPEPSSIALALLGLMLVLGSFSKPR